MARPSVVDIDNEISRFVATAVQDVIGTVGEAVVAYATSRTSKQFLAFLEEVSTGPGQAAMEAANQQLAAGMRSATRRSWGQAKRKLRPAVYDPIRASRFHGGMDKIMSSDTLAVGTARGIEFGPVAEMDRDARQWARLNFGAAPTGQGSSESFRVRFSNLPALQFNFEAPARPGYGLPRGGFKGPDGKWQTGNKGRSGAFYPLKGARQEFPTKGNIGYKYLDAGVRSFFANVEAAYGGVFKQVLPSSQRRGRPPIIAETKRVTRSG